jgi:hypothetical protein
MMLSPRQEYFLGIAGLIVGVVIVGVVVYFLTKKEPYGGAVYTSKAIDRSQMMKRKALNYPRPGSIDVVKEVPPMMQERPIPKDPMRHMSVKKEMFSNDFEPPRRNSNIQGISI